MAKWLLGLICSKIWRLVSVIFFGGRASSYEGELTQAREDALAEMMARASERGANAIIGVKMDYETLGAENGMLMVTCSGTAVVLEP